ncbi:MAG TPA: Asd/ArgC dimerization domain-containing protein [Bryobacteraceae bacterium]|nr:Asd/ArgC dimerization domain-containing protein [Bryobacteraceae bacterium]
MADFIALVGSETLLGREVREVFGETSLGEQLRLLASDEEETTRIAAIGDEPAVISHLDPDQIEDAAAVILAGSEESSKVALAVNPSGVVIDLTGVTEEDPDARVRAPQVEGPDFRPDRDGPQVTAHPAALATALILTRIHRSFSITRAIVQIFEPASERGKGGIDELQKQVVSLLSFQQIPKDVFGAQLGFNLLPKLGEESAVQLHDVEDRIDRHLATLLERAATGMPMPSIRVSQAPVFHGYSFSMWIEFDEAPDVNSLEEALMGDWIDVRGADVEPPDNVGVAGQSGVTVGAITPDRNDGNAVWLWAAADNLRLIAETASLIAREIA